MLFNLKVHNVTSPHTEYGLEPDTEYTVFLQSHGTAGDSLMSTAQVFFTRSLDTTTCPHGQPLYHPNGHRYVLPFEALFVLLIFNFYDMFVLILEWDYLVISSTICCFLNVLLSAPFLEF